MHRCLSGWLLTALTVALIAPASAAATTFTVTTTRDGEGCDLAKECTLRGALGSVVTGDTIRLPAGDYRLTQGELKIAAGVAIVGDGADRTQVLGDPERGIPVFDVDTPAPVEIAHLTVRDGSRRCGSGGNVLNYATLHLHHVAIRTGQAANGGGIANFGALTVDHSLIDGNQAGGCDSAGSGGGIEAGAGTLAVSDSTIAFNSASDGGGLSLMAAKATLERVTIARNRANGQGTGGLASSDASVVMRASVIAANTAPVFALAPGERVSNCTPDARPQDGGGNLADSDECFATTPADPLLSAELVSGLGETPLLTVAATSPAVDAAGACRGYDQRDLSRPQGDACDAGAYEVGAPIVDAGTAESGTATFTFSAYASGMSFECRLDGPTGDGAWTPCSSPKVYAELAPGSYAFRVRLAGASAQAVRAFSVVTPAAATPVTQPAALAAVAQTPTAPPSPTPRYRSRVVVRPTSGIVRVKLPAANRFVDLRDVDSIPLGADIDARKGRVRLYAVTRPGGQVQAASFYGGVFRIRQTGPVVTLQLRGPVPRCGSKRAAASAHNPKKKGKARTRRLWGSGKGRFRTQGRYSAATIRGTKWLVSDSCHSTTTRVVRGVVAVRDFRRHKTVVLRAGGRYVARRSR